MNASQRPGGVIVLQKGRILLTLAVILSAALILTACAVSLAAPERPELGFTRPFTGHYSSAGLLTQSGRRYIGMERPDWLFDQMRTLQGAGPIPDLNLTPTATTSAELYADSASYGELNRIIISSNGVDEDGDGQFDPGVTAADFNLWMLRVDGSFATQLTSAPGDELYPQYSPGARLVAYSSDVSGVSQIYTVEVLTGTIRQLTFGGVNKYQPTWSPDSSFIVFSGGATGSRDLYVMPSDGSQQPVAITSGPDDDTQPRWAHSASVAAPILFTRSTAGGGSRIFRISPDGSDLDQVTNGGGDAMANDTDPAWRHNSQMIAFASDRLTSVDDLTRDYNIYTVSPAGEGMVPANLRSNLDPTDTYDDRHPTFNPGLPSRQPVRIFFSSWRNGNQPDIWRFELSDPVPPELTDLPSVDAPRRYVAPGTPVTVSVPVFDRDSGVQSVVAEFKDPDSAVDDSAGIERKQFEVGSSAWVSGNFGGTAYREIDCTTVGQVQLFDDGDPANGDEVAGDGIFSGRWTTPLSPSDYIIDIHVQDMAGNSFEYDDIYGFTTQMFTPETNVLFVNDYCEGQGFIFNASGNNNDSATAFPVESYYTTNLGGTENTTNVAANTFRDLGSYEVGIHLGEDYDIWRVICRGPITISDLIYYLPTREVQLGEDLISTREVLIADRAVVWAAPKTGNVWVAPGSLVDATTQATLSTFLDRGGRLMISGQDIAFALTLDGTSNNQFLTNYLHASYVTDDVPGDCGRPTISGTTGDPIVDHPYPVYSSNDLPRSLVLGWHTGALSGTTACWAQDAAHYSEWPDGIAALGDAVVTHTYSGGNVAGVRYEQPGGGYRSVYFAWGFEQTHRGYRAVATGHIAFDRAGSCANHRAKTLHNTLCWLRTGGFQGRVVSISDGNQPINDPAPIVQVRSGDYTAAVQCEEDGRYVIGGLPPGQYSMSAHRRGFQIDHAEGASTHGGLNYPVQDFAIVRAEPGAIRGTVVSEATGEPLATVQVCVYEALQPEPEEEPEPAQAAPDIERGALIGCTTTAADGTYTIGNVPPGQVFVVADGQNIGYGEDEVLADVTSGNTISVDLVLTAAPGTIVVTVEDADGDPVENATVDIMVDTTLAASGMTDAAGQVTLEVQPGTYSIEATAPGMERSAPVGVTVDAAETAQVTIVLQSEPPGIALAGLITRGITGEPVAGMSVELIVGNQVLDSVVTSDTVSTALDGSRYNYRFEAPPTGQVTVRPDPTGFTVSPTERSATIVSGEETTGINFTVSSIRTFPSGLQLISLPYDYPSADPADLLGANPATFQMATWDPETGRYSLYPSAPADRFRLGYGYWLRLDQVRELSREGIEAENVHEVAYDSGASGWNLLGCFFTEPIDFYSLQVRDQAGVVRSMQAAMAAGLVRSPLFAYVLGGYATSAVAEPYVGYWFNAGADITLIGDRRTDTLASAEDAARPAVVAPEGGWLMPLVVTSAGMCDTSTWVGCAPAATGGFDAGMDMLKPPPPGMGASVYAALTGELGSQAVDVRPATAEALWTLSVEGPAGETVSVRWPDLSSVPADVRPMLVDTATGRQVYMRTSSSYDFTAREGARELEIRLLDSTNLLAVSVPSARPVGGGTEISYTLSADAQVEVQILNIAGRVVDTVADGTLQTAGVQRLVWDGMTTRGTRAPSGTYLVVVRARGEGGQQTQAIGTVALGR